MRHLLTLIIILLFTFTNTAQITGVDETDSDSTPNNTVATITLIPAVSPCDNDPQEACTKPMTPIILCPDFCDLGNKYSILSVTTNYVCNLSLLPDECIRFTPFPGFLGHEVIIIDACQDDGKCDSAVYIITVVEGCDNITIPNKAPIAGNDNAETETGIASETITIESTDGIDAFNGEQVSAADQADIDSDPTNDDGDQSEDNNSSDNYQEFGISAQYLTAQAITLFPNPASDYCIIEADNTIIQNIQVNNVKGQVMNVHFQNKRLNTATLKTGLYLVHIQTHDGTIVKKLVIR